MNNIVNPIIPGFYPDPSICRVGGDFYLVCSSFELYPGIPVFHSKDLAHWEQLCYAMTKENGFHMEANMFCGGVMAPTIRYHKGTFYIVNANFAYKGNFIVTAKDPAGPWSEPRWLDEVPDIDCSIFFDNDDKVYLVAPGMAENEDNHRGIFVSEFDLENGRLIGERKQIWNSAARNAASPEAPHIYHIGDYYYLMIAEGGTEHYHAVTIARSKDIFGWYEGNPANPVMTHRHMGFNYPIDNVGHADFVDTPDGNWYAVMLGSRIIEGQHKNLGRETYICPVLWERDWPIFSPGTGKIEFEYPADEKLPWTPYPKKPARDNFDSDTLDLDWSFWGTPYEDFWKIENGKLTLKCLDRPIVRELHGFLVGKWEIKEDDCVSFMGKRQTQPDFKAGCQMHFVPENDEAAGMIIMQASNHQYRVEKHLKDGKPVLDLILVTTDFNGLPFLPNYSAETTETVLVSADCPQDDIVIMIQAKGQDTTVFYGEDETNLQTLYAHADCGLINPEKVGGMVGTMIGVYATANGAQSDNQAEFDWFELEQ